MRLLIDTQILIWFLEGNKALSSDLNKLIKDADNEILVSHISLFEIAIKLKIGKLTLKRGLKGAVEDCEVESITIFPVTNKHILAYDAIPFYDDHRDPFDRLILAAALAENIPVVSADEKFSRYADVVEVIQ